MRPNVGVLRGTRRKGKGPEPQFCIFLSGHGTDGGVVDYRSVSFNSMRRFLRWPPGFRLIGVGIRQNRSLPDAVPEFPAPKGI